MTWQLSLASLVGLLLLLLGAIGDDTPPAGVTTMVSVTTAATAIDADSALAPVGPADLPAEPVARLPEAANPIDSTLAAAVDLFGPRAASLDEAEQARRNGDYLGAAAVLRLLGAQAEPTTANEAMLRLVVVLIEAGDSAEAVVAARELLGRQLEPAMRARATFVLGRAQRGSGNCSAAIASFLEVERLGAPLGPYLDLQLAECYARLDERANQAVRAARAVTAAGSRLARVDALEHRVDAALKRGDREGALRSSEQLLALAGTPGYRAKTLASIANINLGLDRPEAAARAYATIVAELPETAAAPDALAALTRLGAQTAVALDEVGAVYHFHGGHADAVDAFDAALSQGLTGQRAARALHRQGVSLLRLDRLDAGVATLREAASSAPDAESAASSLLQAGRALEADEWLTRAGEIYREAATAYPGTRAGQEAHQRLVLTLRLRGAMPEAVATGRELLASGAASEWKGLGLFWAGKALARVGDDVQAEAVWREAAAVDRDGFGGLRAGAILQGDREGDRRAIHTPRSLDPSVLAPTTADRAEIEAWLQGRGVAISTLAAEQATDPNYALAAELLRLGLREQARWELQEIDARLGQDPARLYWLARFAAESGEPQLGIQYAVRARRATGEPLHAQPKLLQRLIFPLPYGELIIGQAERRGVDPLLFAALVRQESQFSATARSSANAIGLSQVVPPTGREIARALGRSDYRTDDLVRPVVSVEFGMYYLADQLETYRGQIYPALAAYNAGGGPVNRWIREFGTEDVDLFAELVPYPETHHYIQVVYENYRLYRRLYAP